MAAAAGIDFQHPQFTPVDLIDVEGKKHMFCFATRLNGDRVSIEAYEEDGRLTVADDLKVRGRFEWDDETDGELSLLVIDGKDVTWDEFGRILMTFEGRQFKIEIYDPGDEA